MGSTLKCDWYTQCNPLEKTKFSLYCKYSLQIASWLGMELCVHFPFSVMLHMCSNHLGGNIWKVLDSWVEDIWKSVLKGCIPWPPKFRTGIAVESFLQARIALLVKKRDSASQPALENLLPNVETKLLQLVLECFYV